MPGSVMEESCGYHLECLGNGYFENRIPELFKIFAKTLQKYLIIMELNSRIIILTEDFTDSYVHPAKNPSGS